MRSFRLAVKAFNAAVKHVATSTALQRVVRARSKPPPIFESLGRYRGKYKLWTDLNMEKAVKAVERGLSFRKASEMYAVPKSTLYDYVSGKVQFGACPGPSPYLSRSEEEKLASFLVQVARIGYPRTKRQVLSLVQQILESKGIEALVTNGWWERFATDIPRLR